ncbi:M18 family aminopeptidase [Corynebacterium sp. TAE3-ERU12]|uniref:M18 family aminopeptidase n=1 Tax=Corynebacterium sp. TAE3-ERU12 TaxID=2849491 RepID=UPI001C438219|nr:M18 family aminopeptidase [Corynebacterium sp. TAE3-ERU12]MBV7295021.1 M18 family aminopeptidase [Corynebacterium sp. TAE3-ERU12]
MTDHQLPHQPHLKDLMEFVQAAPSSVHAAAEVARRLRAAGATEVDDLQPFPTEPGAYVLVRGGAVAAWVIPEKPAQLPGFRIIGSHTDSPGLRLKPNLQDTKAGYTRAQVEVYGGALLNAWLDREIEFAGRIVTTSGESIITRTGPIARIPQLAIHLHREIGEEGLKLHRQKHTAPVVGLSGDLRETLAAAAGVRPDDIDAFDLITADTQPPRVFGLNGEFLACGRLDNLMSVHASLRVFEAMLADTQAPAGTEHWCAPLSPAGLAESGIVPVLIANDHEEVGSSTTTGAAGPMLGEILERISIALNIAPDERPLVLRRSSCISADGAHAVHPNYAEEHDPGHQPQLNCGPVLKINANQRYATDAAGQGLWRRLTRAAAETAGCPIAAQDFVAANHKPCGSTIGPLTATRLGIEVVDVGAPMLSMHSAREMTGAKDPWLLAAVLAAYWAGR